MKYSLFFLFLCSISIRAYAMSVADFKEKIFELEHALNNKHLVLFGSNRYGYAFLSHNFAPHLRWLRKESHEEDSKNDFFIERNIVLKSVAGGTLVVGHIDTQKNNFVKNILKQQEEKGIIIWCTRPEDETDSVFMQLTQHIEFLQENNWRMCISSHSMDFFHKIKAWQATRGPGATMGSIVAEWSNVYRTIMMKYYGGISVIL